MRARKLVTRISALLLPMAGLLAACGQAQGGNGETGSSTGTEDHETGEDTGSSDGDTDSTGDDGPLLDVGHGEGNGCEKVDFLFVVDNSGSMFDEQQKLAASFPQFIEVIQDTLNAQDYQIMVVDTDGFDEIGGQTNCSPEPCCEETCAMHGGETCNGDPCPAMTKDELCSRRIGGGRVADGDAVSCGVAGGHRYIVDGQPDLEGTFECLTNVGVGGYSAERPMDALHWATSETLQGPDGCNEGFLRDDAILVVTFITDEEDRKLLSEGDPPDWHADLVAAKGGREDAIVVLGIVGDQLDSVCDDGNFSQDAPRLRHFVSLFGERGIVGSICSADFTPFFVDAVSTIDATCDEFAPEG